MNIQSLKYIVKISVVGSINQAAKLSYVSQSTLSRAVQEVESETGLSIFIRTNHGVTVTHEGQLFIDRIKKVLTELDDIQHEYYENKKLQRDEVSLIIGVQRSFPAIYACMSFYNHFCKSKEYMNIILREANRDEVLDMVFGGSLKLSVLHYLSTEKDNVLAKLKAYNLNAMEIGVSPLCAQINCRHPLADQSEVTLNMLSNYPRLAFLDDDASNINYASDISQYNRTIIHKRIVVQERGTHRDFLCNTDGYYIGNYYRLVNRHTYVNVADEIICIPISDIPIQITTLIVHRKDHKLTKYEEKYIHLLKSHFCFTLKQD